MEGLLSTGPTPSSYEHISILPSFLFCKRMQPGISSVDYWKFSGGEQFNLVKCRNPIFDVFFNISLVIYLNDIKQFGFFEVEKGKNDRIHGE